MTENTPAKRTAKLYLVPSPLDFGCPEECFIPIAKSLPNHTLLVASTLEYWICENAKTTRSILKRIGQHTPLAKPLQEISITELPRQTHKHGDHTINPTSHIAAQDLLRKALEGFDIGLMSEAGMPAIADPGSSIVRAAHSLGISVIPLVGPISLMLALAASGLNGQNFAFHGYLPQNAHERKKQILHFERHSAHSSGQTQIFIETPYRNAALLQELITTLKPSTLLACSLDITLAQEQTLSFSVQQWRDSPRRMETLFAQKRPAIFLWMATQVNED